MSSEKPAELLEAKADIAFRNLKANIGKIVIVESVSHGIKTTEEEVIGYVNDYFYLEFRDPESHFYGAATPFVGIGSAIQRVTDKTGRILYENSLIPDNYDLEGEEEIEQLRILSFGRNVEDRRAQQERKYREYCKELRCSFNRQKLQEAIEFIEDVIRT